MPESLLSNLNAERVRREAKRAWLDASQLGELAGPAKTEWLADTGWMTQRLRRLCADAFRFDVIDIKTVQLGNHEQQLLNTADETAACREIEFRLESEPLLFAQVILTKPTVSGQPWLESLDVRPLGDELAMRRDVERSDFQYAIIDGEDPLFAEALARSTETSAKIWLRQSVFSVAGALLLVNEVFLPALWRVVAQD